jgi:hypothetical protein
MRFFIQTGLLVLVLPVPTLGQDYARTPDAYDAHTTKLGCFNHRVRLML